MDGMPALRRLQHHFVLTLLDGAITELALLGLFLSLDLFHEAHLLLDGLRIEAAHVEAA